MEGKKIVFSAIQPSGSITLGNYLGALKNWREMQKNPELMCIYAVADLHAITVRQDAPEFRKKILETYAWLIACGISPEKNLLFIQSQVPAHAELAWILNCYTGFGELSRMTQFKDKSAKYSENINAGLFTYPCLMAADILLYQADLVPVGEDQSQHIEITRDIAQRFNHLYGSTFKMPEGFIPKVGKRVMSLADPTKKMSKSDENPNAYIALMDEDDVILRKFKRAVTDSEGSIRYDLENKAGVSNLLGIYSAVTLKTIEQAEADFEGKGYGDFKIAVGEAVIEEIRPIREEFKRIMADKDGLQKLYTEGAKTAQDIARRTLDKTYKKVGFLKREF